MKTDSTSYIQRIVCIAIAFVLGFVLCRSMVRVEDVADRGDHYEVLINIGNRCDLQEIEKL